MSAAARVAFLGTPEVAVPALEAIAGAPDLDVVLVVTNPDRRRGRGGRPAPTPVRVAAERLGLEVGTPEGRAALAATLRAAAPEAVAVVAYGTLLDAGVLAACGAGAVNLHLSLLPRWRGAAPVQAAIRARDATTGISVFRIDAGMDTGALLAQVEVPLSPEDTTGALLERLGRLGAPVLVDALRAVLAGEPGTPQPTEGVTLAPRLGPADLVLDLARDAVEVAAHVRSLSPRPGAVTTLRSASLKVLAVAVDEAAPSGVPGEVVAIAPDGPVVACGRGAVRLLEVRPAARASMSGRDLVNGLRLRVGERLGERLGGAGDIEA